MTTERQFEANRRNARKSTGPRTPEGRANSRNNALKHGFASAQAVTDDEDPAEFEQHCVEVLESLDPVGPLEKSLAMTIAINDWRWRRLVRAETDLISRATVQAREDLGIVGGEDTCIGAAFQYLPGPLAVLARYEAGIWRALQQARHELERLQARRRGEAVAPPVAVDVSGEVNISHEEASQQPSPPSDDVCIDQSPTPPAAPASPDQELRPASEELCADPNLQPFLAEHLDELHQLHLSLDGDARARGRNGANGTAVEGSNSRLESSGGDPRSQSFTDHAPGNGVLR